LGFFDVNSEDPSVIQLQSRLSFKVTNSKNVVLAGVQRHLRYLRELFESLLMKKKFKQTNSGNSTATDNLPNQVPSTAMQNSSLPIDSSTTANLFNIDHQNYLNQKIKSWWEKNRDQYNLEDYVLTEPDDYQIILGEKSAVIKCCCNKKINIPMLNGRKHYQLSNFSKHLTQNGQCTVIERKRARTESDSDDDDSTASLSLSRSSNISNRFHAATTIKDHQQAVSSHKRHRASW
jgi:hypothetical protein